jgi:hypothetical protein
MNLHSLFGSRRRPGPRKARLSLESLEDRFAPALVTVVPAREADGTTRFASLNQALQKVHSGDTIQVEPGSTPGDATIYVSNLTIRGDAFLGGASGLQATGTAITGLTLNANGCTLSNLSFSAAVSIAAGKTGQTINNSLFSGMGGGIYQVSSTGTAPQTNGGNTITGNTFFPGTEVVLGNTPSNGNQTATNDTLTNNLFFGISNASVDIEHETTGLLVAGNRFQNTGGQALYLLDCVGTVSGNVVHATYSPSIGLAILDTGSMSPTNLTVSNNVFTTSQDGIFVDHVGRANEFHVVLTSNTVAGCKVGLHVLGNAAGGSTDYGTLTISGNDLRGFPGRAYSFAILAYDMSKANTSTINAQGNLFSVPDPQTVVTVLDSPGTIIDTSNSPSGGSANLSAMFQSLRGGAPSAAQHSTPDSASVVQLAQAAVHGSQAARAFVDGLYVSLLGRAPGAGEDQGWVDGVVNGMSEEQLLIGFLSSPEYYTQVTAGNANPKGAWVQSLYLNLLGRLATGPEVDGWLSQISSSSPAALASVVNGFVTSSEFRGIQVQAMYGGTSAALVPTPDLLKRTSLASAEEVNGWVSSGLDLFSIEAMLLASPEFASNG